MGSALVYTTFDRHRNQQHIVVSGNENAMKKIPSLASSFPKCSDLETSDDSRSLKRKSMSLNEEGAGGGTTTVPIVTVDLGSLSREQKRELRKRLKLNLDQVKSIAAKIDVREEYLLSTKSQACVPDARANACNSDAHLSRTDNNGSTAAGKEVTSVASELPSTSAEDFTTATRGDNTPPPPPPADMTEREARLARQPSIIVTTEGDVGTPGGTQGKEKRTPKANQLYLNSEFVSGKDKMPPPEKLKPKGSTPGVKRGGGAQGKFDVREGKRQKVEAARAKRMADILRQCSTLLKRIMSHKHAWVFNEPVDAEKLGLHDYHKVINKPMDLGTVKERIANGFYSSPISFADDVRLTFANAMTYNPQGHDVYVMAQVLLGLFNDRWKDIARKLEEENLKIKVEEETLALDDSPTVGQTNNSLHDLHEHLKRVETQIQSLAKSRPSPAVRSSAQAKPRPDDVEKRPMTFEEKRKLSVNLESLPGDKLERIVQIIKKRNPEVGQNEDEIEVDIDSFDNDTLWELDRFITNCMKSRGKKAKKANQKAQHGFSEAPQTHVATGETRKTRAGVEGGEEDVDIDDDLAPAQFAPVVIDKDGGGEAGGSKSSSSDSDSSDSGSSSSDSDSGSSSGSESEAEDAQSARAGSKAAHEKEPVGSAAVGDSKGNLALQLDNTKRDEVTVEETPPERQVSPNKLLRAALLRGRFADTILKAQEKTLPVDKNEKADPEKVRKDREDLERRQKEDDQLLSELDGITEKARLQAEALAAKREAALEARRVREMEREAARRALQQMEKTVEIDENSEILKDLERLRSVPMEQLLGSSGEEGSPNGGSSDGLPTYPLQGGNPLERLGLFMKDDEDEDEHQGDIEDVQADSHEEPVRSEPYQAEGKPTGTDVDVEEGEID